MTDVSIAQYQGETLTKEIIDTCVEHELYERSRRGILGSLYHLLQAVRHSDHPPSEIFKGLWIASVENVPVGIAAVTHEQDQDLVLVYITPASRSQQISKSLLNQVLEHYPGVRGYRTRTGQHVFRQLGIEFATINPSKYSVPYPRHRMQ